MTGDQKNSEEKRLPLLGEVGSEYTRRETRRFHEEIAPTRDEVLAQHGGGDLLLYERLMRDDQVQACMQQRRTAVTSLPLHVDAGGERPIDIEAADHLREQIEALPFDHASYKMLAALMYGRAFGELMFRIRGGLVEMDAIKVRRSRRFAFGVDGHLYMISPTRERMPARKFWSFTCGGDDDDNPNGVGLGHYLYWPVWFKRHGARFWSVWIERFASPTPYARGASSMTDAEQQRLLDLLGAIVSGGRIVIPKHVELEFLEAAKEAGGSFDLFMQRWDKAVSKVILSQTMTTDDGASLSQATVHFKVAGAVTASDSELLCESFQRGPATWLTEWNFPGAATPILWRETEEPEDLAARAQRDKTLFDIGYKPTPAYVAEVYGDGFEPIDAPAPESPSNAEAAIEPGSSWLDTEDGHRLEVVSVSDGKVFFVDLDSPTPTRQWSWRRASFLERARLAAT